MIGKTIAHFEITAKIGEGGMGEVYQATDTKLNRQVALKVLPESFAQDPQRMGRFQREAQVLASLNHPNIAQIYGLETQDSGPKTAAESCLVMELVEGEDLSEQIARGPIPLDEALPIALQIADALEDAHEKGIVHRDLKPANIKLTSEGKVKVLDFGLAKALEEERSAENIANSPTLTMQATQAGMILGTAAYMSPEQARGKQVDRRTDIWAFGAVLYEMLTGRQAFQGEDITEVMASVIKVDIGWNRLPGDLPPLITKMVKRCLQADPRQRLHDIADFRLEIEDYLAAPSGNQAGDTAAVAEPPPLWRTTLPWSLAGLFCLTSLAVIWHFWPEPQPLRFLRVDLGAEVRLSLDNETAAILSPDESLLAFTGSPEGGGITQLYVRRLDQLEATALPGTEAAIQATFSPDGQWIAFRSARELKKIAVTGGAAVTLCETGATRGIDWAEDGSIVFASEGRSGLSRVSSLGGAPEPLTKLAEREVTHRWPQVLPGGEAVLYTAHSSSGQFDDAKIVVQRIPGEERKTLWEGGHHGRYLPTGHLAFIHEGTLFAAAFDLDALEIEGQPTPMLEGVVGNGSSGAAQFAFSEKGALVYVPGTVTSENILVWVDRKGAEVAITEAHRRYGQPRLSPDGGLLALEIEGDIWIYDLARGTTTRVSFEGGSRPAWTPDGKQIVFTHSTGLFIAAVDGSREAERVSGNKVYHSNDVSPDGQTLLFHAHHPGSVDTLTLKLDGQSDPQPWLATSFAETGIAFSPDGKWIVYLSNESGRSEVYIRPFPGPGGRTKVSTDGGDQPAWKASGEIFYKQGNRMMAVQIQTEPELTIGRPEELFEGQYVYGNVGPFPSYDVTPDGRQFVMVKGGELAELRQEIVLVLNWFEELNRLVPTE